MKRNEEANMVGSSNRFLLVNPNGHVFLWAVLISKFRVALCSSQFKRPCHVVPI